MRYCSCPSLVFSKETTGLKDSTNPSCSSKRFGKTQKSYPRIQTDKNMAPRDVTKKNMKIRRLTERYQTNTFRKVGQIGKQVQKRNPAMRTPVIMWLNAWFPS
mmetsp:Transcript_8570/g.10806  ORF Transcript_8570/g.10806 Transcript_8570/m.10806 type:complete len:103 (-) Transcript_8570:476-784(-)